MQTNIQITSSKQEEHGAKTYSFYSNNDKIQIKQHVKQATVLSKMIKSTTHAGDKTRQKLDRPRHRDGRQRVSDNDIVAGTQFRATCPESEDILETKENVSCGW